MAMKDKDLLELTNEIVGELTDFGFQELEGGKTSPVKDIQALVSRDVPGDYKQRILLRWLAIFIVICAGGALLCDWLKIDWEPIISLRIAIRSALTALLNAFNSACVYLMNHKIAALFFGLALLLFVLKRRR